MVSGRVSSVSGVPLNAPRSISDTDGGMVIAEREVFVNVHQPIVVTVSGILISVRLETPLNKPEGITVIPSPNVTSVRLVQPLNGLTDHESVLIFAGI